MSEETRQILERLHARRPRRRGPASVTPTSSTADARSRRRTDRRAPAGRRRDRPSAARQPHDAPRGRPPADGVERDVAAVGDHELAHDREPEAEVTVRATVAPRLARLPEPVERARALLGASCPGPSSLHHAARPSRRGPRRRAAPRCRPARPRARCSGGCRRPARADPASRSATGVPGRPTTRCARASRPRTRPTPRTRPSTTSSTDDRRRIRRRTARRARARAGRRRAATAARPRRARRRGPRRPAPSTSASRFSSRSRSAASGVRSWCDASATNAALRADELLEPRRGGVERLGEHR